MIKQLDAHLADLIAAGEVVDRPASVIKELIENAIDAGATHITVEANHGGTTLMRVTDDGCGIPPDQVQTAFLRHATSKISCEYDLEAITTLGFRGEALAAISAVSCVQVLTRTEQDMLGTSLVLEGGTLVFQEELGCPVGTTMVVRDLFFNTPARQKFMKRDQAESAAIFSIVQREALAHPEVSIRFLRDGRQDLLTPGDGQVKNTMYSIFGREIALGFLPIHGSGDEITVKGFVTMPTCCRGSRNYQFFFVNGRYVKSLTMQTALEEAYKNQKMVGKYPGCVIYLTCKYNCVDVNVHPAKTEVKFVDDQQIFSAVYHSVRAALEQDQNRPAVLSQSPEQDAKDSFQNKPFDLTTALHPPLPPKRKKSNYLIFRSPDAIPNPETSTISTPPVEVLPALPETPQPEAPILPPPLTSSAPQKPKFKPAKRAVDISPPEDDFDWDEPPQHQNQPATTVTPTPTPGSTEPSPEPSLPQPEPVPATESEPKPTLEPNADAEPWIIRGELFRTYIMVEQGDKVLLIDKHAAHERMNFDRLRAQNYQPMAQQLLTPLTLHLSPEECHVLLDHLPLLAQFGFALEEFGGNTLVVRQVPGDLPEDSWEETLLEIAQRLIITGNADSAGARDELLHTMACKAAIKGGWKSGQQELETIAAAVMNGSVRYCPHGRPVAIELTRKQLEKQLKRT